jgi:hypothetical protein
VLGLQGRFELRRDVRRVQRRDAEMQRFGGYVAVRGVSLECQLQRRYASLRYNGECLRRVAVVYRPRFDLRPEWQRELLRVERGDWRHV